MISARVLALSLSSILLAAPVARGEDLSSYRGFQFGMNLPAVVKLVGMKASEARVLHQHPALIQELEWRSGRFPGSSPEPDSVKEIAFSFYNGELFQMVVNYDRYKTEGLSDEDMIEGISKKYGAPTRPEAEILFPSLYNETVKVIARWEDSQYSLNLVRSSYQTSFGMILSSKRLDALAQTAITDAIRQNEQEGPRREADRQKKQEDEDRVKEAKARLANKPNFRP
jgi:hypothetical protein